MRYIKSTEALMLLLALVFGYGISPGGGGWMSARAAVRCPSLFSDHMVFQGRCDLPVWGWAEPGETVKVECNGQSVSAAADSSGRWRVILQAMVPGGPHTLTIAGENEIRIEDVLVGEVWLCSGQSNMAWRVQQSRDAEAEIAAANLPRLRMFMVEHRVADLPQDSCNGAWVVCSPETAGSFSAAGYFFGRDMHKELDVPVGLIHSSWGGTPVESWMSLATLKSDDDFVPILDRYGRALLDYPENRAEYQAALKAQQQREGELPVYHIDGGNEGIKKGWAESAFDDRDWIPFELPAFWDDDPEMEIDGAVWFRKTVAVPPSWKGKPLILELGAIDDFDVTYFNGVEVGSTGEETPGYWQYARKYSVPGDRVESGETVIAVRVFDHFGQGGFGGYGAQMSLTCQLDGGMQSIPLAGSWRMKVEKALDPSGITGPGGAGLQEPIGPSHPYSPCGLYNAMIHPLAPYALKGAVWYQGEANASRAHQYRKLLPAMIQDWRTLWGKGDLYFGIVQLANFMAVSGEPAESEWAELREAQALAAMELTNSGLAVAIDIGEADDIHPKNKQDVGRRLALWALAQAYARDLEFSGPVARSMQISAEKVFVRFDHTGGGLTTPEQGEEVKGFAVAGSDGRFYWARAEIAGGGVTVWSDEVDSPVAVRYAWGNNPVCNLYNASGLPAVPFRSDRYNGITLNRR